MSEAGFRYGALVHALRALASPAFFDEVTPTERAVRYRSTAARGIAPLYDVYVPRAPTGAAALLVHGGGFALGARDMLPMRFLAARLAAAGIAACSVDYRMIFRGGRLDEALDDVRAALDHFRDRGSRVHGLDPKRVSLVGLSAGGTLAMLTASASSEGEVHRLACGFGLYELDHLEGGLASVVPRLLFRTRDREVWSARSPRGRPQPRMPTLLLHGTADGLVPHAQAERLAAHRRSLDLPTRLVLYPGAPHGFFHFPGEVAERGAAEIVRHLRADEP